MVTARTQGKRTKYAKPFGVVRDDQLEGATRRLEVTEVHSTAEFTAAFTKRPEGLFRLPNRLSQSLP